LLGIGSNIDLFNGADEIARTARFLSPPVEPRKFSNKTARFGLLSLRFHIAFLWKKCVAFWEELTTPFLNGVRYYYGI